MIEIDPHMAVAPSSSLGQSFVSFQKWKLMKNFFRKAKLQFAFWRSSFGGCCCCVQGLKLVSLLLAGLVTITMLPLYLLELSFVQRSTW